MRPKAFLFYFFMSLLVSSCSKNIHYTPEQIQETSGRYLYNPEEVIDVYYENNTLFLKWKGAEKIEPVALDAYTFFVPDMYQKLRFVQHPDTHKRYLSIIPEDAENMPVTYDYLKVDDAFKTPAMHLKSKEYSEALAGYLDIQKQDSTSVLISEQQINSLGYKHLREKEYQDAIEVFKMNVALFPGSDNVYDSLADAYATSGDSLQAFYNFKEALKMNSGNNRAKTYIAVYQKSHP